LSRVGRRLRFLSFHTRRSRRPPGKWGWGWGWGVRFCARGRASWSAECGVECGVRCSEHLSARRHRGSGALRFHAGAFRSCGVRSAGCEGLGLDWGWGGGVDGGCFHAHGVRLRHAGVRRRSEGWALFVGRRSSARARFIRPCAASLGAHCRAVYVPCAMCAEAYGRVLGLGAARRLDRGFPAGAGMACGCECVFVVRWRDARGGGSLLLPFAFRGRVFRQAATVRGGGAGRARVVRLRVVRERGVDVWSVSSTPMNGATVRRARLGPRGTDRTRVDPDSASPFQVLSPCGIRGIAQAARGRSAIHRLHTLTPSAAYPSIHRTSFVLRPRLPSLLAPFPCFLVFV
ncbi:hypothetical protein C8R47DRAFT_1251322, partial [Mycena vitilis]